jgi:hypothetical protein
MRRYIIFQASWTEIKKQVQALGLEEKDNNYRMVNGATKSYTKILAEHYDSSGKSIPKSGDRLTESVPTEKETPTLFRDSGWEVVEVHEYTPEVPAPYGAEFDLICLCYCEYEPLDEPWVKTYHRLPASLDSFGGNKTAYESWLAIQTSEI